MRRSTDLGSFVASAAIAVLSGCVRHATSVEVALGTDAPPDRALTISAFVRTIDDATSFAHDPAARFQYGGPGGDAGGSFGGSFAVVPRSGQVRGAAIELRIEAVLSATASAPEQRMSRQARFAFVPETTQLARLFMPIACANPSTGCSHVDPGACTVSLRCEDQGLTCGDDGVCVAPEVALVPRSDAGEDIIPRPADTGADAGLDTGVDAAPDSGP
ncbi:MAG: hypothetical protein WCJ30_10555, partial [Deltaproteobacteria bacterium]